MEKKIKYYLVQHSYDRNYREHTSYCYTTNREKAQNRLDWANNYFACYNVSMQEVELTEEQVKNLLEKIGDDMVKINNFNESYFIV